jgi:hypothetical protein
MRQLHAWAEGLPSRAGWTRANDAGTSLAVLLKDQFFARTGGTPLATGNAVRLLKYARETIPRGWRPLQVHNNGSTSKLISFMRTRPEKSLQRPSSRKPRRHCSARAVRLVRRASHNVS